jgi:hypothetical protein
MVGGPAGRLRQHAREAQRRQVQRIHEGLNRPDRVLLGHVVVDAVGEQCCLPAIATLDEALHPDPP